MHNICAIIPVYNHQQVLRETVASVIRFMPIVLVDDGSDQACQDVMAAIAEDYKQQVHLVRRDLNGGKGAAVKDGFLAARSLGYTHGLQIDADGQHDISDIPVFVKLSQEKPTALIAGYPRYDDSVPWGRLVARYLTHVWVWINTLSLEIKDSMCGFRVYPLSAVCAIIDDANTGDRMDFDSEIIVRWHWKNLPIVGVSTSVIYLEEGISHFRLWLDNRLISQMHARLFLGMLRRFPILLANKFKGR